MREQILTLIHVGYRLFIDNGWQAVFLLTFAAWMIWACCIATAPQDNRISKLEDAG